MDRRDVVTPIRVAQCESTGRRPLTLSINGHDSDGQGGSFLA